MDFSSTKRALESLHRRQPPLSSTTTLQYATELLSLYTRSSTTTTGTCFDTTATGTTNDEGNCTDEQSIQLLRLVKGLLSPSSEEQERWEPLAVGLYIATEIMLQVSSSSLSSQCAPQETSITTSIVGVGSASHPVYMDGPRVPLAASNRTIVDDPSVPVATTASAIGNAAIDTTTTNDPYSALFRSMLQETERIELIQLMHNLCIQHLEHNEPRLRILVAKAIGAYCSQIVSFTAPTTSTAATSSCTNKYSHLISLLQEMYNTLTKSIQYHIELGRDVTGTTAVATMSRTVTGEVDDTTGWRAIETNWFGLASFINGCSTQYYTLFPISEQLYQQCSYCSITHINRHVRAAAMQTYEQWIHVFTKSILLLNNSTDSSTKDDLLYLFSDPSSLFRITLIDIVKAGLADNWSPVRMAASVLCRTWFLSLQTLQIPIENDTVMMSALLPRMCLNRFYLAHGVKVYSHESWKMIFSGSGSGSGNNGNTSLGLKLVMQNINAVIRYYIKMCDADNFTVREAACQAIAELAIKVGPAMDANTNELLLHERHVQNLMSALLMCFYDESWPVRDQACLACGTLCRVFPKECHHEIFHRTLWGLFEEQLTHQIWSLRENAAIAMGDVLDVYGAEILPKIQTLIKTLLPSIKNQTTSTTADDKGNNANNVNRHINNQVHHIGGVAPRVRKGGFDCADCLVNRPKSPWEATDGCVYLIREYILHRTVPTQDTSSSAATLPPITDEELFTILSDLADVCRVRHIPQADELRATLWKCIPTIAHAIGKQRFKNRFLDLFLDLLFETIDSSSSSQLTQHAASQCMEELATLIGANMFRARLDERQRQCYDRLVYERQSMSRGPMGGTDIFSPFGPHGLIVDIVPP